MIWYIPRQCSVDDPLPEYHVFVNFQNHTSLYFSPKGKGLVAAKFEADWQWYRAEVITFNTHVVKLRYIDFGNESSVPLSWVQPLESRHQGLPAQVRKENVTVTRSDYTDVCDEIFTQVRPWQWNIKCAQSHILWKFWIWYHITSNYHQI